jgi:hypothetical protein
MPKGISSSQDVSCLRWWVAVMLLSMVLKRMEPKVHNNYLYLPSNKARWWLSKATVVMVASERKSARFILY